VKLTGAQIVAESLIREDATVIFGILGGAILPFYDTLPQYPQIRHILVRHEQGAAHAAEGYARAAGKVGVCISTSGPGATNLVTGIADAYMDSVPIVAITGQVARPLIGKDAFQEIDITGITLPITKHNYLVPDAASLPQILRRPFILLVVGGLARCLLICQGMCRLNLPSLTIPRRSGFRDTDLLFRASGSDQEGRQDDCRSGAPSYYCGARRDYFWCL